MKVKYIQFIFVGLVTILFASSVFNAVPLVYAQSLQNWSDPINLSRSGSSTDPVMVIDSNSVIHVVWVDAIDGYKYAASADGKVWTSPQNANFPFSPEDDSRPTFFANSNGIIYILWRDKENALFYGRAQSEYLGNSSAWSEGSKITDSVADYHAVVDSQGILHLSYVKNLGNNSSPAGVYYGQIGSSGLSETLNIYSSEYFRSLDDTSAHVRIAISNKTEMASVYVAWDNPILKRIFMAESIDAGQNWGEAYEVVSPEANSGYESPHNAEINVIGNSILLTWQVGQSGIRCAQYSRWSESGGNEWGETLKMFDGLASCPERIGFFTVNANYSIALLNTQDNLAMIAWNGNAWSDLQIQNELSDFLDPVTFDALLWRCQQVSIQNDMLFVIGCDEGKSDDIWFASRSLGSIENWFPSPSAWSSPSVITSVPYKISSISSVADTQNNIHLVWVQSSLSENDDIEPGIFYALWNGKEWSKPAPIIINLAGMPTQLSLTKDNQERLLLGWVDEANGELLFSWANSSRANVPLEWTSPKVLPSPTKLISSPNILIDGNGSILVAYAISLNENRGIYIVRSDDLGENWSSPSRVFDGISADWDSVDQPEIVLTGDGKIHALFSQYLVRGDTQPLGLYYSQSVDGGTTWDEPKSVTDQPVYWSKILSFDHQTLHLLWQEKNGEVVTNYHQISADSGLTWTDPINISFTIVPLTMAASVMDLSGQLHFLQLLADETLTIQDWLWDGLRWNAQETREIMDNAGKSVSPIFISEITPDGHLNAVTLLEIEDSSNKVENRLVSFGRSIDVTVPSKISSPGVIRTPASPLTSTDIPSMQFTPTAHPSLADLNDSTPGINKNILGLGLIATILTLMVILIRPSRSVKKG
jgi:hypothetical protein